MSARADAGRPQPAAAGPRPAALDTFVALLSESDREIDPLAPSSAFYNRLCEAVCRLTSMDRAALFLYDEAHRRVRAVGAHVRDAANASAIAATLGAIDTTLEEAPLAQRALAEDRVVVASGDVEHELPAPYARALALTSVACIPVAAGGRWLGVLFADRDGRPFELDRAERDLMWSLGKTAALAACSRIATREQERARQLRDHAELAREIHESIVQRLFALTAMLRGDHPLSPADRQRCAAEAEVALADLRRAIVRPLAQPPRATDTTLAAEVRRLQASSDPPAVAVDWPDGVSVPDGGEVLAQAVLSEALRNIRKHAPDARKIEINVAAIDDAFSLEIRNDGVERDAASFGVGLRLAALEALEYGGVVEYGLVDGGVWHVRLLLPLQADAAR